MKFMGDKSIEELKNELKFLYDNHTFDLVKLPDQNRVLNNKWSCNSMCLSYKDRIVVKDFSQKNSNYLRINSQSIQET